MPLGKQPFTNGVKLFYWQPVPKDEKGDGLHHFIVQVFNCLTFSLQNSSVSAKRQILVFLLSTFSHVLQDTELESGV